MKFSTSPILVELSEKDAEVAMMVKCGAAHTAVLTVDGTLYTWGSGKYGATGLGSKNSFYPETPSFKTKIERKVKYIDCSKRGTFVVTKQGQVFGCGDNHYK